MLIYGVTYIALISFAYLFDKYTVNRAKARREFCIFAFLVLGLLWALRHPEMAIDIVDPNNEGGYYQNYILISKIPWDRIFTAKIENYETGYIVFNKLLSVISDDPQLLLAVTSFICAGSIMYVIYSYSDIPLLSVAIYMGLPVFIFCISGLRQALAISITLVAFVMIVKKRLIPFLLLVWFATLFHASAVVFIIAYPLYYLPSSRIVRTVLVISVPIVYLLRSPLFSLLAPLLKENATEHLTIAGSGMLFWVFFLIVIFQFFLVEEKNKVACGACNLFLLACYVQAFSGIYDIAMRVGYYFMIYSAIAIPSALTEHERGFYFERRMGRVVGTLIFVVFTAFALDTLNTDGVSSWSWYYTNPYRFYWE